MDKLITVDEAFQLYERELSPLPIEELALDEALGRVLAEDVQTLIDLPPFPQSAMDGYALRSQDTQDATPEHPARLRLVGEVPAGALETIPRIQTGEAARIFTGGYVPEGADTILRQEDAIVEEGWLIVRKPVLRGKDVRLQGEEIQAGETLAAKGERLTGGHLAALAITGVPRVNVHRKPRISVLTTGDEVVPPGQTLKPGQVYDANTSLIAGWLRARGYTQIRTEHLPDDLDSTVETLQRAFERSDLILTVGGISVGERDFVLKAAGRVGVKPVFWKVRQRPGKPLFFGMLDKKPLLGLPGNPGSVFVCLITHVRRVLDVLEGTLPPGPIFYQGCLREPLDLSPERERWVRCALAIEGGTVWLKPLPRQGSHMVTNLTRCTALARIPTGENTLPEGSFVPWTPI
jgi:molybdopterin molybdotransferase